MLILGLLVSILFQKRRTERSHTCTCAECQRKVPAARHVTQNATPVLRRPDLHAPEHVNSTAVRSGRDRILLITKGDRFDLSTLLVVRLS